MSPAISVCRQCGEKTQPLKTDQAAVRPKTVLQAGQRVRKQHKSRTDCQSCSTRMRTVTAAQRPRLAPVAQNNDVCTNSSPVTAGRVTKRAGRSRWHHVQRQEFRKLRKMLPSLHQKEKVSKLELIEEAIRYIEELHSALVKRFKDRGFPPALSSLNINPHDIDGDSVRELIRKLLANVNPGSLPPTRIENIRTTPSFLLKTTKGKKT